jgi:hypothetical protein|tara:strand:- start:336 stop:539 length:204 start_codon:yes stop_codon:yes gene_type:complete
MLEIKMMKGKSLIIKLGTSKIVKKNGLSAPAFEFLKNSISSKRLRIIPKQKTIKITISNDFEKFLSI